MAYHKDRIVASRCGDEYIPLREARSIRRDHEIFAPTNFITAGGKMVGVQIGGFGRKKAQDANSAAVERENFSISVRNLDEFFEKSGGRNQQQIEKSENSAVGRKD